MAFTCSKKTSFAAEALFVIIALFTSCDSFLESKTVKQEIEQHISYANAPAYKILVQANDEDGTIKKPITGELIQKVTDTFEIKFAPAQDHEFVRWEASSVELPEGESIYDYISFEDASSPETKVTFKKALNSIVITAFCPSLPYVSFLLTGSRYGKFSPVKGTYTCIQTYSYPLSFDPDTDYEFIRWKIYDSNSKTETEIPNGTYIKIENPTEYSTTYSLVAVPLNSEISLAIKPVITERPQILSRTPIDNGDSFYKDSRIQVLFDHEMDEASIYYTKDELKELIDEETDDTELFPEERDGETVYFGYKKDGVTYFKNIVIKNYESNVIINDCFDHPYFETPTLLIIPANRSPEISNFTIVHVSIEKDLSYKVEEKPVNMPKSERWVYQVSNTVDIDPPQLSANNFKDSSGNALTSSATTPSEPWKMNNYKNGISLNLEFSLNDQGSGLANKFIIERAKVCDVNYNPVTVNSNSIETTSVNFQVVSSKIATYNNTYTISNPKEQGVYRFRFAFYDKSNNPAYFPESGYFYYNYDKTAPTTLKTANAVTSGNSVTIELESDSKDYNGATVYYYERGTSNEQKASTTSKTITISNLLSDTWYDYYIDCTDLAGNTRTCTSWLEFYVVPPVTSNNQSTYDNSGNITLSWNAPSRFCDGYEVTYTYNGNTITQNVTGTTLTFAAAETNNIETIPVTIKAKKGNNKSEPYTYNTYSSFTPVVEKHDETSGGNHSGEGVSLIISYYYIKIKSPENSQGFTYNIRYSNSSSNSNPYYSTDFNFDQDILVKQNSGYPYYYYFKVRAEKDGKEVWSKRINVLDYWPN